MADKYFIETFGCQMNVLDSEKIAGNLSDHGFEEAESLQDADVVILNTCSVRDKAVQNV
ncbi:MAG: tRNA (N6-isopentenyl adenosine(37)-C2)-methylthiotransferase MiaB, partial [Acidobacteriota bacterium]